MSSSIHFLFFASGSEGVAARRGRRVGGLKGEGARREGARRGPKGGGPKFRAFFSLPPEISFFLLSLGVFSLNFGGGRPGRSNVHVWALWLSCAWKGVFATSHCLKLSQITSVSGHEILSNFDNTHKSCFLTEFTHSVFW